MKVAMAAAEEARQPLLTLPPRGEHAGKLEACSGSTATRAAANRARTCTTSERRSPTAGAGHLHALQELEPAATCCSTRACTVPRSPHRQHRPTREPAGRRRADHQCRVDQKVHRDRTTRGYSSEAVTDTILRRDAGLRQLHLPAVLPHGRQSPAGADGGRRIPSPPGTSPPRTRVSW